MENGAPLVVYETVEQRCMACVVYGGPEDRCVGENDWDKPFGEKLGRPCPRVDLDPSLAAEAELLSWLIHDDKRPLAEARYWTIVQALDLSPQDADLLLARVSQVLSDETVIALLHPEPERPEKPAGEPDA